MSEADAESRMSSVKWDTLVVPVVLLAFGFQLVAPLADPILPMTVVLCMGLVHMGRVFRARSPTSVQWSLFTAAMAILAAILAFGTAQGIVETARELRKPCGMLRAVLLKGPNSEAADTYQALNCPAFYTMPWKK